MEQRLMEYIEPFINKNKILKRDFDNLFSSFDEEMMSLVLNFIDRKAIKIVESHGQINRIFHHDNRQIESSNEELCVMYQRGNELALDALIQKNQYLVYSRVNKYQRSYKHDLSEDDLFQEGCMGLMRAAEKFNNNMGFKLTTYAIYWIDQGIMRAIADQGFTVRVPVHMFEKINKLNNIYRYANVEGVSQGEIRNIAMEKMDVNSEQLQEMLNIYYNIISLSSLNVPIGESGENELGDMLEDLETMDVVDIVTSELLKRDVEDLLDTLTEREKGIINLRFGLKDDQPRTLEEIGKEYSVTRERIRQIESKALRKLRHPARSRKLRSYLYEE